MATRTVRLDAEAEKALQEVQEATGLPTELWNPLSGLKTSLSADQVQAIGPSLAVAVGLGARGVK